MVVYADSKVTRTMDAYQIAKLRHFLLHSIAPFLGHESEIVIEHNDEGFDKEGNQMYALKKMHKDFVQYMRGEIPKQKRDPLGNTKGVFLVNVFFD